MAFTIGVMIGNANSPYTIDVLNGVYEAAKQTNVNIICFTGIHSSYFYKDKFEKEMQEDYDYQSTCVFDYDKLCHIDALIVAYSSMAVFMSEKELAEFKRRIGGIPTVYLESDMEGRDVRYITEDSYSGIKLIMKHLIKYHGYEKILFLSGPKGNYDADRRRKGYKDAMMESDLLLDKSMIAYGDFSENVESQVNKLLDLNPDAEAICCANDTMAVAAYSVIRSREEKYKEAVKSGDKEGIKRYTKYIVGQSTEHGIAVTGYDNIADSANVEPQLTTVVQSPFSHGFTAVRTAISLLNRGEATNSVMAIPKPVFRQSCGCKNSAHLEFPEIDERYKLYPEQYAATVSEIYTNGILPVELNDDVSDEVYNVIYEIVFKNVKSFLGISDKKLTADDLLNDIKEFMAHPITDYIPKVTFVAALNDFLASIIKNAKKPEEHEVLMDAEAKISDYVYSKLFSETREELAMYRHRIWFMPLISRDMASNLDSLKDMYYNAISKIKVLEIGDAYIFLADETIVHRKNEKWECPKELRLVAYTENGQISAFDPEKAPVVSKDNVINNYIKGNGDVPYKATVLNLCSGESQYGIIVAKLSAADVLSLYCAAVQISSALKSCELAREQRKAQRELQSMIKEVEEKNEILRSMLEYDQLTGCFNRRGFIEKSLVEIRKNAGKKACLVFADLDHLKEINDRYGHPEGDYAIENCAKNIRKSLPEEAIIARLGGDEFVAFFVLDDKMDAEMFAKNIANTSVAFNAISAKPYYVECSVGYNLFDCLDEETLEKAMEMADESMYEAKSRRRKSIVKKVSVI